MSPTPAISLQRSASWYGPGAPSSELPSTGPQDLLLWQSSAPNTFSAGCLRARMIGASFCVPRNSSSVCVATVLSPRNSLASSTIRRARNGPFRRISVSTTWSPQCDGNSTCSAVGRRDPRNAAKADPLIAEFAGLVLTRFAIDAVRIDLAIVDAASLLGKAIADIIAVGLDLPAQLDQCCTELYGRHRRHRFARSAETRGHHRFFHRSVAAFGAGDLTGLLLRLEPVPVTKPPLEFVAASTAQREQDHRDDLRSVLYTRRDAFAILGDNDRKPGSS